MDIPKLAAAKYLCKKRETGNAAEISSHLLLSVAIGSTQQLRHEGAHPKI